MNIVIPAAGFCSRWGHRPKCLHEYQGVPILLRSIQRLKHLGKIIVVVGYKKELIKPILPDYVDVVENRYYYSQNVCGSVSCAIRKLTSDKVLVVMGDVVYDKIEFASDSLSKISFDRGGLMGGESVGMEVNTAHYLSRMGYEYDLKWQQFVYLTGMELDLFFEFCRENPEKFAFEGINYAVDNGGMFLVTKTSSKLVEIDTKQDTKKLCIFNQSEY